MFGSWVFASTFASVFDPKISVPISWAGSCFCWQRLILLASPLTTPHPWPLWSRFFFQQCGHHVMSWCNRFPGSKLDTLLYISQSSSPLWPCSETCDLEAAVGYWRTNCIQIASNSTPPAWSQSAPRSPWTVPLSHITSHPVPIVTACGHCLRSDVFIVGTQWIDHRACLSARPFYSE